jgi:hypothetical protein
MQIRSKPLSSVKQQLIQLYQGQLQNDLGPFLASDPMTKGTVYRLRRKCSKPSCRCVRGVLHESTVLTASLKGKTHLWTVPGDRIEELRKQTENYRRFRQARAAFIRKCIERQNKMVEVIDAIEQIMKRQPD